MDSSNERLAHVIVFTLKKLGVTDFFISPGYRNAPMITALSGDADVRVHSFFDERSAAFAALGTGRRLRKPAVVCCTSGTAGANYFPAVVEAAKSRVPLIVLTTDRPFELPHSQANQVIDQSQLFGRFCRESIELPLDPAVTAKTLSAHIALAFEATSWPVVGPVHINCPFRAPLEPAGYNLQELAGLEPFTSCSEFESLTSILNSSSRPLLILGELQSSPQLHQDLRQVLSGFRGLVYADILSQAKYLVPSDQSIHGLSAKDAQRILNAFAPDLVLQIGGRLVGSTIDRYMASHRPDHFLVVNQDAGIGDIHHQVTHMVRMDPWRFLEQLASAKPLAGESKPLLPNAISTNQVLDSAACTIHSCVLALSKLIPEHHVIFLGNSTVIRAFDRLASPRQAVFAQRGVSGIEGHFASAYGLSVGSHAPVSLFLGDIAALYDLNSLFQIDQSGRGGSSPVVAVIFNNGGGHIFDSLPIGAFEHVMNPFMTTPHTFDFSRLCESAGLGYCAARSVDEAVRGYLDLVDSGQTGVLEVKVLAGQEPQF